jgi:hypothetical protein
MQDHQQDQTVDYLVVAGGGGGGTDIMLVVEEEQVVIENHQVLHLVVTQEVH